MSDRLGRVEAAELNRRSFIGGSDARIIMGEDEAALTRLWREKRGEAEPEDLSGNLIVQLGVATEELNRRWYEANSGQVITDVQSHVRHPGPSLDGGDPGRPGGVEWRGVRGQIHVALVVLGRGGGREVHAAAATQHVGRCSEGLGSLRDHRRRQVGGDQDPRRSRSTST